MCPSANNLCTLTLQNATPDYLPYYEPDEVKTRVADHGEVFTPAWMVEAKLDLVKARDGAGRFPFLEPACGAELSGADPAAEARRRRTQVREVGL